MAAHTELSAYRAVFKWLIEDSRDGFLLLSMADETWEPQVVNAAFQRMAGVDAAQIGDLAGRLTSVLDPEWLEKWRHTLNDGGPSYHRGWFERTNRCVDMTTYPLPDHSVAVILRDVTERLEREQELTSAAERMRLIADHSDDLVFETAADGTITWISSSAEALLGYLPQEMVGRPGSQFVHPEDRALTGAALRGAGAVNARLIDRAGDEVWMSFHIDIPVDATDQRRVGHGRLIEPTTSLAADALNALADPHVLLEPVLSDTGEVVDFTYLIVNEATCAWLRRPREEIEGQLLSALYPHVDPARLTLYVDTVRTGMPVSLDDVLDPKAVDPLTAPRVDLRINKIGNALSITWRDVSQRFTAEQALIRSESIQRAAVEQSVQAQTVLSSEGMIIDLNPAFAGFVDRHPRWLVNRPFSELLTPPDARTFAEDLAHLEQSGPHRFDRDYTFVTPEGRTIPARVALSPVVDNSKTVGIVCSASPAESHPAELPQALELGSLNDRELHVLQALAQGMENSAIAEDLFLSVKAVENYVTSIFRKLDLTEVPGVNRRVRAALIYERSRTTRGSQRR